jgi:LacI family transcriptional regulator
VTARARERPTLRDVADALGLSVNTVSRALAGRDAVSEQTRALVRAEARRLGYVPNAMARSLALGSAMAFGLVITNPSNPFYATLISSIERAGRARGYSLVLLASEESAEVEDGLAEQLLRWGVDGAIVVPVQQGAAPWERLRAAGLPLVLVNRDLTTLDCDFVGVDYRDGAYRAARHLLDAGAVQVHLFEEDLPISPVDDRIAGFRAALAERGMTDDTIVKVPTRRQRSSALPWQPDDAYRLAQGLTPRLAPRSAIMVGNDYFALGVYRALREAGRAVPHDVAVIGYGDHPFSPYLDPALSSVRLPTTEIGNTAVNLLVQRLGDTATPPRKIRLKPTLVVRDSSRQPSLPGG